LRVMRHKSFILVAAFVFLLVAGAVGAYAYDSSREDVIADGVTIAGLDVGGMRVSEARALVRRELADKLERPVVVRHRKQRFRLSAAEAQVRADVGGMVDDAVQATRDGNVLTRVYRDLTGGRERARVPARVTYSRRAVAGLVARVRKALDRPAQDARVDFPSLNQVQEKKGLAVRTRALRRRVEQALAVPDAARRIAAPTRILKPKVTRAQLADRYPVVLVAERNAFQLKLYKRLQLQRSYTVAVGAIGFNTPAGLYHIQNKAVNPAWSVPKAAWAGDLAGTVVPGGTPENPLKARWLGIFAGAGIHGTDQTYSLGHAASHGCIRMAIPDVIELYDQVSVGTPIYIA
jgi:lipoprotein-anchoring transpeptidase ErfK/SrfK